MKWPQARSIRNKRSEPFGWNKNGSFRIFFSINLQLNLLLTKRNTYSIWFCAIFGSAIVWRCFRYHTKTPLGNWWGNGREKRTMQWKPHWHFTVTRTNTKMAAAKFQFVWKWSNLPQRRQFSRKYGTFGIVCQRPHSIRPRFCRGTKNPFSAYFVNCKLVIGFSMLMPGAYVRWKWSQFQLKWKINPNPNPNQ